MKRLIALLVGATLVAGVQAAEKAKSSSKKTDTAKTEKTEAPAGPKVSGKSQEAADGLTAAQKKALLSLLNEGTEKQLESLPGLGDTRAKALIKARPLKEVTDLLGVEGVGEGTFMDIVAQAKKGLEKPEEGEPKKKPTTKKGKKKTTK
ncbi:MAG: helix-hairpin-helix domain-containing protein [Verrucomicrobiaceae bacterium]|nr:helix-hairpin-helix domain-containing protein [Verrucomicrobiaceae bacterium]